MENHSSAGFLTKLVQHVVALVKEELNAEAWDKISWTRLERNSCKYLPFDVPVSDAFLGAASSASLSASLKV